MPDQERVDTVAAHALGQRVFADILSAVHTQVLVDIMEEPDADHGVGQPLDLGTVVRTRPRTRRVRQPEHQRPASHGEQVIEQADVVVLRPSFREARVLRPAPFATDRH